MELCPKKINQRWLWQVIDAATGVVLAFAFGRRTDAVCKILMDRLSVFKISTLYTDNWDSYGKFLPKNMRNVIGKKNTQKIENRNLYLRTRIKRLNRKTIGFSKLEIMHDTVIGLFINQYMFN